MTIKTDNLYFQKLKNSFRKLQNMHICCKTCKKHTGNTFSKKKKKVLISKENQNVLFV